MPFQPNHIQAILISCPCPYKKKAKSWAGSALSSCQSCCRRQRRRNPLRPVPWDGGTQNGQCRVLLPGPRSGPAPEPRIVTKLYWNNGTISTSWKKVAISRIGLNAELRKSFISRKFTRDKLLLLTSFREMPKSLKFQETNILWNHFVR